MRLLRLVVLISLVALCGRGGMAQTEPRIPPEAGQTEASRLIHSIQQLLIAKGLCADRADCVRKQYALAATVYAGLNVYVYQLSDPELLSDVIKQCALVVFRRPDIGRIELKIYTISKAEHLDTPFYVRVPHKAVTFEN
jgi:hypothetical protein